MKKLFFSLLLCLFLASPSIAQEKNDIVGGEKEIILEFKTQLVVVPFSALDRTNRSVNDLKAEDIKLYENGQPAQLVSLQRSSNQSLNFALLLDLSGSMQPHLESAQSSATRFFDQALNPEKDRAGIVAFQQEIVVSQPLTNDKPLLKEALTRKHMVLPTSGTMGPSLDGMSKRLSGTALYGAIYVAVDELLQTADDGHRVLLLISDGYDSESGIELRDALDYAWRREVTIYTIGLGDVGGLNREVLERLCSATGGRAFYPKDTKELDEVFHQIDRDLREQYILSFYPNSDADDLFRTIKIELPKRPSLTIRHRFGYYNALVEEGK
ncbi:MAG: von Willebrand factor type A domain-containing protein [bacterium]|nr:MAG: von Willebrand factor type A domain-containing protein [bacterium]